jgi:hypothetical protein
MYNTYAAAVTEVTAIGKSYICYGIVYAAVIIITAIFTAINLDDKLKAAFITLRVACLVNLGIYLSIRTRNTKINDYIEKKNLKINQFGLCMDYSCLMFYIYVFEPLGINESYKNYLRTAKYFN